MESDIINVDNLQSIEVLDFYVSRNINEINSIYAYNLGREYVRAFNLLKTYFYDTSSLSAIELERIPHYLKLFELCGISEEILKMSKEELLDLMDIRYCKIIDNTQVLNDD